MFETEVYARPVHRRGDDGRWATFDGRLVKRGERFVADLQSSSAELAETFAAEEYVTLRLGGDRVSFGLQGAGRVGAEVAADRKVRYPGVLPHTDVEVETLPVGVKETLVLHGPGSPTRFVFPIESGLRPVIESGAVVFRDASGAGRAVVPPGWMEDSNPDAAARLRTQSEGVSYALVPDGDGVALEVRLDEAWLRDPARIFPVRVDPVLADSIVTESDDTYVAAFTNLDRSAYTHLYAGNVYLPTRSFLHFDLSELDGAQVHLADLVVRQKLAVTCDPTWVDAYRVTQGSR